MTGPGQIALENTAPAFFNATNTYTGGTIMGYPGVASFSGTVNFNNGRAFGTGPIIMSSSGSGCALVVEGTAAMTITNAFIATNVNMNIVGNAAGLTFSGPWNLGATPGIGSGGTGNLITISGTMTNTGGFTKYNASTLVLSGANTYSGLTTVSNGVLSITADNNLGTAPANATVNITLSGGTLNASNTFTLNAKRQMTLTANSSIGVSSGKTLTYGGVISGSANLTKTGTGTLAISGANGYTGMTTISAGTFEADSQTGSAVGNNTVLLQSGGTLTGTGVVSGLVSGNGSISPGTPASGPGTLTLGNGLDLSSGGTLTWKLTSNSTAADFSEVSLIGGNLNLGGTSKTSINFSGTATAPSVTNAFWQTQEEWTIISVNGGAVNSNNTKFASIVNGSYAAGNFTNIIFGNDIVLLYQPNFTVLDTLYDAGPGFFSGENLILTNFSGLAMDMWSTTNASLAISNWTLIGPMQEQPLAPALPGYSRYSINVNPTVSPTYYIAGNFNTGPYLLSPVPATILTTEDFSTFTVTGTNTTITTNGVLGLVPPPPVILPGSAYSSSGFQFQFSAGTNQNYTIQASGDLVTWSNIATGTVSSSPVTIIDPNATNANKQFYRVVAP
jgi:autotransporter-associated beta strand protein